MHTIRQRNSSPVLFSIFIILALVVGSCSPPAGRPAARQATAYVEASLYNAQGTLSVIVGGETGAAARRAVERLGGQIIADLWLIDSVAAELPAGSLAGLAATPGVRSVTANKQVATADSGCGGDVSCSQRPGWVTDRRERRGGYSLEGVQPNPALMLPGGGFVSVADNGKALIANPDGSILTRFALAGGPFRTGPALNPLDGSFYLAGEGKRLVAVNSDGSLRWSFASRERFQAGPAVSSAGSVI